MFIALELRAHRDAGIFRRMAGILTRPKARLSEATALGARYLRLMLPLRKGRPDWAAVGELAGRLSGRILLPDDVTPPEEHPAIRALPCPRYERRVLAETASGLIQRTRIPMYKRVLGLIDRDGDAADLLPGLLRYYTAARVVTAREELYERVAGSVMEELGAPVLIGSAIPFLAGCALILAPGAAHGEEGAYPGPVLAGEAFRPSLPCDVFTHPEPDCTLELRELCPPGIAPHRFAAALYEDAGVKAGGFTAARLRHNGRQISLENAVRYATERTDSLSLY